MKDQDETHVAVTVADLIGQVFGAVLKREKRPWPFDVEGVKMIGPYGGRIAFHFPGGRVLHVRVTCQPDDATWQHAKCKE